MTRALIVLTLLLAAVPAQARCCCREFRPVVVRYVEDRPHFIPFFPYFSRNPVRR